MHVSPLCSPTRTENRFSRKSSPLFTQPPSTGRANHPPSHSILRLTLRPYNSIFPYIPALAYSPSTSAAIRADSAASFA